MLTVDFRRLGLQAGDRVLDLGCGGGRHAFEAHRRGAHAVAFDRNGGDTKDAAAMLAAMRLAGEAPTDALGAAVNGDALALPFADGAFDRVIAAEVLEHVPAHEIAIVELARVLRPGGTMAVTVPRWFPERVCWALAEEYHAPHVPEGHVRIYRRSELAWLVTAAGLRPTASHHAHALHTPYWWLKCALGLDRPDRWPVRTYHRFLLWDITHKPFLSRALDRALNPVLGKSLVLYATKP
ncbi:MAG TPA: methyltransferase domain-containing protein [Acidimicrobiales bacterium]|nr:methyltransferase domain-containing protein [Acidimicrobiales bacterium]